MPVYVFECERCYQRYEIRLAPNSTKRPGRCERRTGVDTLCGGKLRRVYTPPVIRIN
jgi:predicted nucleic acid-binding Zn ribbon protein